MIALWDDKTFKFQDTYSMTLNISVDEHDHERLEVILDRKFREKYE